MEGKSHASLARIYKAVFWLALIFMAWQLLQLEAVINAIMMFSMAGVVPGTDIRLSPDAMLRLLPVLFLLSVILVFHKELWRGSKWLVTRQWRRTRTVNTQPAASAPAAVVSEATPQPAPIIIKVPRQPGVVGKWLASQRLLLASWLSAAKVYMAVRLSPLAQAARLRALQFALAAKVWLLFAEAFAIREGRRGLRYARDMSVRVWRWAKPHIQRFDAWLAKQVQAQVKRDSMEPVVAFIRESLKSTRQLWQKTRTFLEVQTSRRPDTDPDAE